MEQLSYEFIGLLAEAFGLPRSIMCGFYETDGPTPHRAKVVKYPPLDDLASNQGVGPHFDGGFLTFVRPSPILSAADDTDALGSYCKRPRTLAYRFRTSRDNGSTRHQSRAPLS